MPVLLFFAEDGVEMHNEVRRAIDFKYQREIRQEYESKVAADRSDWSWLVAARSDTVGQFAQARIHRWRGRYAGTAEWRYSNGQLIVLSRCIIEM